MLFGFLLPAATVKPDPLCPCIDARQLFADADLTARTNQVELLTAYL